MCEVVDFMIPLEELSGSDFKGKSQCFTGRLAFPGLTLCPGMFHPIVSKMLLLLFVCSLSLDKDLLIPVTFPQEHLVMVHLWERLRCFL